MPTWVFIKITESNCSEIARAAVQRCKELDDMVYKFPFKMYRYADKFWDKKEIISFLENTIYEHGIYYTATSHGTPVLKPYISQLKKSVNVYSSIDAAAFKQMSYSSAIKKYVGINDMYIKYKVLDVVKPNKSWLNYGLWCLIDGKHTNLELSAYGLNFLEENESIMYMHISSVNYYRQDFSRSDMEMIDRISKKADDICKERREIRDFKRQCEEVHA